MTAALPRSVAVTLDLAETPRLEWRVNRPQVWTSVRGYIDGQCVVTLYLSHAQAVALAKLLGGAS
jgi:hypothetical protein